MSTSDKEVEKQLFEAGEKLLDPPSSLEELLSLLDKANQFLSEVEQSPPDSMQKALSPLMKALVAAKLFKHSDEDVKVAVAACISEITRITAPDAPYNDDQMKEVFQLIVSTFEQLVDESSRSYSKRTSILETVAKVRSCVVMLDLECDALIIEMFRHFLKAIRDHHSESGVYTSMETIMNLVLEESEDISPEMLSPILEYAREDDEVPKISRRLAEKVLSSCASKLKTYLTEAVKLSGVSLDKYSNVVTSICEGTFNALKEDQVIANEKEDNQGHLTGEAHVEDTQKAAEISTPEQTDAPKDESGKSGVSNGVAQIAQNDSPVNTDSTMKQDDTNDNNEPQQPDSLSNTDLDNTTDEKTGVELNIEKTENQPSSVEIVDSSKTSVMKEETDTGALVDNNRDVLSSPPHDSPVNADVSSENEKKIDLQALPSKTPADETTNVDETSLQAQDIPEESRSKKVVNQKKKENSEKEPKPSASSATKEVSEEPNTSEAKLTKKSGKKATSSSKAKPKRKEEKKSTSETKAKQSGKKAVETDTVQESSKPKEEKNKPERGKGKDEESLHTYSGDNDKPAVSSGKSASKAKKDVKQPLEETPNTNTKRKRSLDKGKASDLLRHDDNLVGSRIKVWWPMDRAYYNGVVDSYDSTKKRHLICYDDGDQEILNLKNQKFYFLDESESSQDEEADQTGHDEEASTTPQKKKAKTDKEQSVNKQSKTNSSSKKGSGAGSSKSKAASTSKSSKKSEDDKTETKPKDSKETNKEKEDSSEELSEEEEETPKPVSKPATTKSGSSKSKKDVPKSGKSKDQVDSSTPKAPPPSKKKEETSSSKPKSAPAKSSSTKGKTGKASGKSNKAKTGSASSKAKESDDVESDTEEKTPKVAETTTKGKSAGTSKSQTKSGKKRKR